MVSLDSLSLHVYVVCVMVCCVCGVYVWYVACSWYTFIVCEVGGLCV